MSTSTNTPAVNLSSSAANGKYDFAVVGAGRMGASIAGALALSGARVAVYDRSDFDRKKGLEIMRADMRQHENSELISASARLQALDNVFLVESLDEVVKAPLVVEAIFEDLDAKRQLFKSLEEAAAAYPDTVFATNSMNYMSSKIALNTVSATRVHCGVRFLHPVFFIPVVELCSDEEKQPERLARVAALLERFLFEPFYHSPQSGMSRRRLDPAVVDNYMMRQRTLVEAKRDGIRAPPPPQGVHVTPSNPRQEGKQCLICFEEPARALLAPCGHCDLCLVCCNQLRLQVSKGEPTCPTCRVVIERVLQMDQD